MPHAKAVRGGGIIPACAGSTTSLYVRPWCVWGSSPHARGAQFALARRAKYVWDHPRMRGEHSLVYVVIYILEGIIPACAGSTSVLNTRSAPGRGSSPHARGARKEQQNEGFAYWDHPRMRGEHLSSTGVHLLCRGIIPACAGSTYTKRELKMISEGSSPHARGALSRSQIRAQAARDHPRMRGEH